MIVITTAASNSGCWIVKVVISSDLGGTARQRACNHAVFDAALSVTPIAFMTEWYIDYFLNNLQNMNKKNNNNATNDQLTLPIADHRQCMPEIWKIEMTKSSMEDKVNKYTPDEVLGTEHISAH
ncbi:hypothetical protein Tco_0009175 [Tanacetum coccineum]